jgi:hypothetical protein
MPLPMSLTAFRDCDENWHGNSIAFQDLKLQTPDLVVYAHHKPNPDRDVELCGVVRCGKKLTHPIIRPVVANEPTDLSNRTGRQFELGFGKGN